MQQQFPRPASRDTITGQAILDTRIIHIRDVETAVDVPASSRETARAVGYRSLIAVPMMREGQCIGAIILAGSRGRLLYSNTDGRTGPLGAISGSRRRPRQTRGGRHRDAGRRDGPGRQASDEHHPDRHGDHVEQKNGAVVRQLIGYDRFASKAVELGIAMLVCRGNPRVESYAAECPRHQATRRRATPRNGIASLKRAGPVRESNPRCLRSGRRRRWLAAMCLRRSPVRKHQIRRTASVACPKLAPNHRIARETICWNVRRQPR